MRKENNSLKDVLFTKADVSTSESSPMITFDSENDGDNQEPLPPLPKLTGAEPSGASKMSQTYVIKKKTEPKHPTVQISCPDKSALLSTEQLLLTLMEEVKGIKNQILIPLDTSLSISQASSSKTPKQKDYQKRSLWYLDSGCSRHMTRVKQYLHRYSKESGPKVVFGDNFSGDTKGYGSVNCNGITFTKVAYVNGLKHNLISISQLCDANFKVLFTKTQGTIFNEKDEVVLIAPKRRDVYVIDMSSYNTDNNACFYAKAPSVNWLWHKRLSHLDFKTINNLSKYNLVFGLPSLTFSKDKNCSACEKGKHHRATFKTKRSFSINKCLHLLYMDLFGPVKPQTISHNKYTLVIVDEYSRQIKNLNDNKVKQLRTNNGTEFRNHTLEAFCDEKAARTMLNSASLPKQFWGEAVNAACYTQNRSIIVKRHRKTAYEVFRGRAPDISHFHVFGCPVYIHNHRDHLGKFDEKAHDGFFLGYSLVAKAFRVFNIRRQEMEETFHVTFSEDDEAISQTSTEGDAINSNKVNSFLDDEFREPRNSDTLYVALALDEAVHPESAVFSESTKLQEDGKDETPIDSQPLPQINSPSADVILQTLLPKTDGQEKSTLNLLTYC
ncbi:retrovirus-related pol polyprotein from transposon TNT 1-94 [Tanacetum coccineum]